MDVLDANLKAVADFFKKLSWVKLLSSAMYAG